MLTSHHYLLGGLVAVSCATGILSNGVAASQNWTPVSAESAPSESVETIDAVDVSYRGSGRTNTDPETKRRSYHNRSLFAHRGSGRVVPDQAL